MQVRLITTYLYKLLLVATLLFKQWQITCTIFVYFCRNKYEKILQNQKQTFSWWNLRLMSTFSGCHSSTLWLTLKNYSLFSYSNNCTLTSQKAKATDLSWRIWVKSLCGIHMEWTYMHSSAVQSELLKYFCWVWYTCLKHFRSHASKIEPQLHVRRRTRELAALDWWRASIWSNAISTAVC